MAPLTDFFRSMPEDNEVPACQAKKKLTDAQLMDLHTETENTVCLHFLMSDFKKTARLQGGLG